VTRHILILALITGLAILVIAHPYLPGRHDALAVPLSILVQTSGVLGVLLILVAIPWLAHASWRRRGRAAGGASLDRAFALVAFAFALAIVVALVLLAIALVGPSLGGVLVAPSLLVTWVLLRRASLPLEAARTPVVPSYLLFLPLALVVSQSLLAAPLTAASRDRAIASSAGLIADIEAYREANGRVPVSLEAAWRDYPAGVIGIDGYRYAPRGDAYAVSFEQPRFLLDDPGAREFVMFDSGGEHLILSHDSWVLLLPPEQLASTPGWYAARDATEPGWRIFLFD
jgi:hypothetical protein